MNAEFKAAKFNGICATLCLLAIELTKIFPTSEQLQTPLAVVRLIFLIAALALFHKSFHLISRISDSNICCTFRRAGIVTIIVLLCCAGFYLADRSLNMLILFGVLPFLWCFLLFVWIVLNFKMARIAKSKIFSSYAFLLIAIATLHTVHSVQSLRAFTQPFLAVADLISGAVLPLLLVGAWASMRDFSNRS